MKEWAARQLQLAWFIPERTSYSAYDLFRSMVGSTPTATNSTVTQPFAAQPGSHLMPGPIENAQGQIGGVALNLSVQHQRIDVIISPIAGNIAETGAPLIRDVDQYFSSLERYSYIVSKSVQKATRLGFTSNYVFEHASPKDASNDIMTRIGLSPDKYRNATELNFGINNVKNIGGVNCNRIVRWQPEAFTNMTLSFGPNGQLMPIASDPIYAAGVSMDINTVISEGIFLDQTQQQDIFVILIKEGRRLWKENSLSALADN